MTKNADTEQGVIVAPAVRDLSDLATQLAEWLGERMPTATGIRIENLQYPLGAGQSHETILFDATWEDAGQSQRRGLVVRIKPTSFTVFYDDLFLEQFKLMQVLHESGLVRVAEPLWFEEDPSLLGAPFFVMEKLAGRVAVSIPSYMEKGWVAEALPNERARLWENSVRELAAIQSVPLQSVAFLAKPGEKAGFDQEWDRWVRYLDLLSVDRELPFHRAALRWLAEGLPTNRPPGLVWGDARLGNMMVGEDFEIVAVMDWEQPSLGGALHDLAWWLFHEGMKVTANGGKLPDGFKSRAETIALWEQVTGISTADLEWYEAFAAFKLLCLGVRMMKLRGIVPSDGDYSRMPGGTDVGELFRSYAPGLVWP